MLSRVLPIHEGSLDRTLRPSRRAGHRPKSFSRNDRSRLS
jgi:hypothetical protein